MLTSVFLLTLRLKLCVKINKIRVMRILYSKWHQPGVALAAHRSVWCIKAGISLRIRRRLLNSRLLRERKLLRGMATFFVTGPARNKIALNVMRALTRIDQ
jgi:hypothetical protein